MFTTADSLLQFLQLERERPSLDYLNRIVREHQLRVPFETFTKLLDYEPGLERGDFMPPIEEYVERIVTRGAGGLCWTLARGLQWLLTDLGFHAALMHMQPGHCCVRVELPEGPFYADVGYGAPIFQAYPLFESFSLDTHREKFEYNVTEQGILVTRNPGPTKILDPTPLALEDLRDAIIAANRWHATSFLTRLTYAAYIDGVYTSINNGTLRRHIPGAPVVQEVDEEEIVRLLREEFGADPALYTEAAAIHAKWMAEAGLAAA